ncbi:DUF4351 domain-containing protein [Spirulina sp. CS-785/01]|nr:DUF4351 domain-containing protein [Spirulina sp. CS-785/01]MDB9313677.1 DUF4351 domain-containing protein [Spirulina sp. CS-785/01]
MASALMAKMQFSPEERPRVKLECLRLLATLRLDPARMKLISGFIDTYLRLNAAELEIFQQELDTIEPVTTREEVMQITTSWKEEGLQEGLEQGLERERNLVTRQIKRRLGELSPQLEEQIQQLSVDQIEALGEALLDFQTEEDLLNWLAEQS